MSTNQFRYMKGDTKSVILRTPPQAVLQGITAPPFCSSQVFCISRGDLCWEDPRSGCIYPAALFSAPGNSVGATSEAAWQIAFAAVFVGIAEEKIGLAPGEFSPNPSLMYQDAIKIATAGEWEMDCPNQIFSNTLASIGIYATGSGGILDSQTVDSLAGFNTTTTGTSTSTVTTLSVASGTGIVNGTVIQVATEATNGGVAITTTVPTNVGASGVPASGTGGAGTATGSAYIPLTNGTSIGPGVVFQVASELIYVTAIAGFNTSTSLEGAVANSTASTTIQVASTNGIVIGCAILIDTELMVVTQVSPAAQPNPTIVVNRAAFGSTAGSHANAAAVTVYPVATVTRGYNQTTAAAMSGTAAVTVISTPPENMYVSAGGGTTTLTVIRGYSGTTAAPIASGAVVTALSTNNAARIGTIAPSWGMQRNFEANQPQNRVIIELRPAAVAGGYVPSP